MTYPNDESVQALERLRPRIVQEVVARLYADKPATWEAFGELGRQKSLRDVGYHLDYLAQAVRLDSQWLLLDYLHWAKVLFKHLGFAEDTLDRTLAALHAVIVDLLPGEAGAVYDRVLEEALLAVPLLAAETQSFILPQNPFSGLARRYLDALLQGDRRAAQVLITKAVESGTGLRDLYLHVFEVTQQEIGRLWQVSQISVAQEHYCTASTQLIMAQLYPIIFRTPKHGGKLVAACVGEELHELGLRMVCDFFELEGWDTYYLGANVPPGEVIQSAQKNRAHLLALSTTITRHLAEVADLTQEARAASNGGKIRIMVGGYPFKVDSTLWQKIGADGTAGNAAQSVALGTRLAAAAGE